MKSIKYILIILFAWAGMLAQDDNKLYVKHFTKKNKIIFRLVPKQKSFYSEITNKALSIVRYDNVNGVPSNSVLINEMLRPYFIADSAKWLKLFREDKESTGFLYSAIYPASDKGGFNGEDKTKFDQMTYEMMLLSCNFDRKLAIAAGLYQADSAISNSKKYTYKFAVYTTSNSGISIPVTSYEVDASVLSINKQIEGLKAKGKNNTCDLNWNAINYSGEYFGYNIYRSTDSINYTKVNSAPVIFIRTQYEKDKQHVFYKDTMSLINKKHFYFIRGINLFGEESAPSNIVSILSIKQVNSNPIIDSLAVIQNKMIHLNWRMADPTETTLPKKYLLQKSEKENKDYKTTYESSTILNYTDKDVTKGFYYRVIAVLGNNDSLYSLTRYATIIDTTPPSTPKNLKAIVDKKGIVTLSWQKGKESDIQGYKLFKSNRLQDEFVQINEKFITDSFSTDKLNLRTLSKKMFYKVAASDNNFNTSILSEAIEVKRPDTIPPQAPILVSVFQNTNAVVIKYILSNSEDVGKEILLKKGTNDPDFKEFYTFNKKDSIGEIADTITEPGLTYTYKLLSADEDGNTSYSRTLEFLFETGFRKKIKDITFSVDRTAKKIDLVWKYDEKNVEKFVIYRSKKDEKPTIIKTLEGNTLQFTDKTVNMGNVYEYRIKAAMANGAESIISSPISVEY